MTDRDALLAAILAHPDEDTPRLMFADALEEDGDTKNAKFIRAQIELAKVPEWDPLWLRAWHQDRDAITGTTRWHKAFVKTLPAGLSWPPLASCRRGFPDHIESRGPEPFLKHADKLAARVPLQALTVNGLSAWPDPINLTPLLESPHLGRLKHLTFSLVRLTRETVRWMQEECPYLRNLTSLSVEFTNLDGPTAGELVKAPLIRKLEALRFEECAMAWNTIAPKLTAAGGPHRLRSFVVTGGSTTAFSGPGAFRAPLLRGLKEFELSGYRLGGAQVGGADVRALCSSPVVEGLESLTLNNTFPGVAGLDVLAECPALKSLKRLRLAQNKIGPAAVKGLARSPHLSGLRVLDLQGNPLGDNGAIALAGSPYIANLIELELMNSNIGDAGAEALMEAVSEEKLINLSLSSTPDRISAGVRRKLRKKFGDRVFA